LEVAEEMFLQFMAEKSLNKISQDYKMSITAIRHARDKYGWEKRKEEIGRTVFEKANNELVVQIVQDKKKQLQMVGMMMARAYHKIAEDFKNIGKDDILPNIIIKDANDVEKIVKIYYNILHEGVLKSQDEKKGKVEVEFIVSEKQEKQLREMRQLVAGNPEDVEVVIDVESEDVTDIKGLVEEDEQTTNNK